LKLIDRPLPVNIGPGQSATMKAGVKVASTDAGVIFGNVTYDSAAGGNIKVIQLAEMNIDVLEYIVPATCTENEFREMWAMYGWETKVNVVTNLEIL
jgi:coatomer subunit beta